MFIPSLTVHVTLCGPFSTPACNTSCAHINGARATPLPTASQPMVMAVGVDSRQWPPAAPPPAVPCCFLPTPQSAGSKISMEARRTRSPIYSDFVYLCTRRISVYTNIYIYDGRFRTSRFVQTMIITFGQT